MIKKNVSIKIGNATNQVIERSGQRIYVVILGLILGFSLISFKVVEVSISSSSNVQPVINIVNKPKFNRHEILDRNNNILAINLKTPSVYANPQDIDDPYEAANLLTKQFPDLDYKQIYKRLKSDKQFVWIKRQITPKELEMVNYLGIPGIYYKEEERRIYPHRNLASHILGYINIDGKGISGIENQFDDFLTSKNNANQENNPLKLSIDISVQQILHQMLQESILEFDAIGGCGVIMDVNTGQIIAMVSLPDFDSNNPQNASNSQKFNRATLGVYEMGSTFKTFNIALAQEHIKNNEKNTFDVSQPIKVGNFTIRDYHSKNRNLDTTEIYIYSSNIGSAKMALEVGTEKQKEFFSKLGLLSSLNIEIPEKSKPLFPQRWGKISTMTASYGHGIAVTPIHLTQATSALVNGGIFYDATLLANNKNNIAKNVVTINTSDYVRKLMRFAVEYGTGKNADATNYFVGGKTGSADKAEKGSYDRNSIISSFMAAFPMNEPKYSVFIMIDEPKGNKSTGGYATGGVVAAPVAKKVIERIGPILDLYPVNKEDYKIRNEFWYDYKQPQQEIASIATANEH